MKRLYTSFSSLKHVAGTLPLHPISAAAASMPWANASFAQQIPFSFSQHGSAIL